MLGWLYRAEPRFEQHPDFHFLFGVRYAKSLIKIKVGGENINATSEHPFWVVGKGWIAASALKLNDELSSSDGSVIIVTGLEEIALEKSIKVYNLEVEDFHTYFVSKENIWVHNDCDQKNLPKNFLINNFHKPSFMV